MKRLMIAITLLFSYGAVASSIITCPTADAIRQGQFDRWLPLYKDNSELASEQDTLRFQSHVLRFAAAEWSSSYLEQGHCLYQGTDPIIDKIIFARDAWQPEKNSYWSWIAPQHFAKCSAGEVNYCRFIE